METAWPSKYARRRGKRSVHLCWVEGITRVFSPSFEKASQEKEIPLDADEIPLVAVEASAEATIVAIPPEIPSLEMPSPDADAIGSAIVGLPGHRGCGVTSISRIQSQLPHLGP